MRFISSPYRVLLVALALVTVSLLSSPAGASAATTSLGCGDNSAGTTDLSSWVPEMLAATNSHRTGMGLVALQLDPVLTRASVWKSRDMGLRNYFSHDDLALPGESSRTPWERLTDCGWTKGGSRAENIAAGQSSGQAFITAWLNSPGHRANIENANMRYVGFGVARVSGSRYGTYATQMFASVPSGEGSTPPPPPPPTPASPTVTQLSLDYQGAAKTVCPASGSTVTYRVSSVTGQVDATNSGSCVRVAPRTGVGGVTAYVDYHARNVEGGTSPNVRMTVTVAAAPPPPPPPPVPASPTVTQLALDYQGAARTVCPASGTTDSYRVSSVTGQVDATNSGSCVRVAPRAGVGGVTAYVDYHARNVEGGTSANVRMTVTVAAAPPPPPPPPPPTPATPTTTQLAFAFDGPTQTVCPTAADVTYVLDRTEGWIVAGITEAGCLRVSAVSGTGGITGYVTYHALHSAGGTSPTVRMTVTVAAATSPDPGPDPDPTPDPTPTPDPVPPTPLDPTPVPPTPTSPTPPTTDPTTDTKPRPNRWRGVRVTIERFRCRGPRAVRGWCWRAEITGRLVDATGHGVRGVRATILRRIPGRFVRAGRDVTSATGAIDATVALRPPARGTATWMDALARTWRLETGGADATVTARR